jgi:ankyrin repeat protein
MSFQSTANILSFFFEFKETSHGSVLALVKSLLSQLLDSNQALIRQIPWKENPSHRQDLESLTDILFSILRNSDFQITCIIDGLDECENESLETLVNFIVNLSRIPSARAILTYCQGSEVGRRIGQCEAYSRMVTLDLSNQNTEDVAKYTKERCIDFATKRELPEDVKRKLLASLENHHNGRFVWVTLILQLLGRFRKVGDIKTFLDHLPVELPVVYKTLLDGVTTEKKPNMYRSLYYLQCAARPLSVRELSMCLGIEDTMAETTKLMDNLEINLEDDLRTELGRALVFDEGNVFFAHPDLGQFIGDGKMGSLGEEKTMKEIHFELAYACLVYLTMGDLLQELPGELLDLLQKPPEEFRRILINGASFDEYYTEIFKRIPLLEYACYYWPYHLSHSEELALGASTVVEKLLKKNIEFPFWQNIFRSSPSAPTHFPTSTTRRDILSSLNLAKLLKKPDSTMTNNLDYRNVLHYAVKNSAFQSFEFYLSLTKDPGGSDERNKLALACIREHADEQKKAGFYAIIQKYQHSEIPLQIPRQNIDIHGAVRSQNSDSLNTAIRASGGNVNAKDPFGYTALHYAIDMQLLSMVTILMKCGADPEVKDPRGRCSLHSAAEKGDAKIASLLLEFGAKSDAIDHSNQTALHYSALRGSLDVTKLLVQWRANTSPKDKKRQTPMHFAASFGNIHIVKLLVDCVSKVSELDSKLRTPLFTACSHGRMPAVKLLLELGIGSDIFLPDIHGQHPLHVAARNGHLEILTLLLSSGVKSSPRDNRRRTPLHEAALRGELPMVQRLLKFHADYALVDMDGRTPLHDACRSPFPSDDVVKQLLESGASWNARDQEGRRPIHYAARSGKAVVIEDLLDAAEQLNLDPEDSEPSYINSQDFQGRTPLHMAVYLEHPNSVLQLLMRHGCLAEMTDVDGKTALQLAIELKCHDATVFLRAQKATPRFSLSDLFPLPSGYSHPRLLAHQDSRLLKIYHPSKDAGENAPILCSFVQLCLHQDEARGFEYDALSYWWGTDEPTNKIWVLHYIRGSERTRTKLRLSPVYIRSNLYSALKQFRHPTKDLYLWVDALCIDQKNKDEKSSHVLKIRDIYAAAKQVRIWLGPSSSMRAKALRVLYPDLDLSRRFQSEHTQSWEEQLNALTTLTRNRWFSRLWVIQEMFFAEKAIIQCGSFEGSWNRFADVSSKLHLELSRTHRYVIHEQPLRRAWALLLQSFGDAKSLLKGQRQYRLPDLNTSNIDDTQLHVQNDSKKLIPQEEEIGYKSAISVGVDSKMTLHSGFSLEMLVTALTPFETSDPRDTVYAVMGIANDTTKYSKPLQSPYNVLSSPKTDFDIIPDYNRSIIDVFIEFVRFCVLSSHSLDIICRPWAPQPQEKYLTTLERVRNVKEPARAVNIPSWIVMNSSTAFKQSDFLQGRRGGDSFVGAPRRPLYSASQTTDAFARFPLKSTEDASRSRLMESFDGSIQVRGVRIGHVDILGPRAVEGMLFRENLELLGWTPVDDKFQDGQISDRLWRTLVADRGPDGTPPPAWYKAACAHALELRNNMGDVHTSALIADREEEESSELVQFLRRVQSVIWNRKPFGTTRGYVGIAPSRTSQGDVICVLLGCSVPVILRKMHQIGNCYELIGESYVHGIMDGEALELGVIEDFELR